MSEVWKQILDRTKPGQDEPFRWEPPGIPLPAQELRRSRCMGEETMTVVAAILIVVAFVAAVLLIRALTKKRDGGSDPKRSHNGTDS